ncbi:MAG: S8 family serine peptidase [Bacteroidota bacterium]|nr:S8 family serine peptidase [Bacteroidota bacterium]MDP4235213.1 S8 family serine peptidase [Bacteroidota bacterium]
MRSKNIIFVFVLALAATLGGHRSILAQAPLSVDAPKVMDVVPGVVYINLKANRGLDLANISPTHTGNADLDNLFARIGVTEVVPFCRDLKENAVIDYHGYDGIFVITFSAEGRSPRDIAHDFLKLDVVSGASPRYNFQKCYTPNDPSITTAYALNNSHMHVLDAWGVSKGNANIIIADLDEGVNYNHEDLTANIYKLGNYFGRDIVGDSGTSQKFKPDNDPMPGLGQSHGTFTTGCFGAVADNGKGAAGSGFNCKIMAIKIADNAGNLLGGYEGIAYAWMHGAKILNCSWGGYETDPSLIDFFQTFIDSAVANGALIVAAAGNDARNIDQGGSHFIPAYLKNVLTVGASDINDLPASFTNFGKSVDVYAPGANIFSTTFPGNSAYDQSSGTSFACPLTSGVAGLVWAKNPTWLPKFVMRQIIETCDNVLQQSSRTNYWGRVNAYSALTKPTIAGLGITDYKIDGVDKGSLNYTNKVYSIDVSFKNYMFAGSGIQAKLLPIDGTVSDYGGYKVQAGTAALGSISAQQEVIGSFKFSRDGTDGGMGAQLPLFFAISYGTSGSGSKYFDTLVVFLDISGDNIFVTQGVSESDAKLVRLEQNFPNPVSGEGTISFELAEQGYARLSLTDMLGRENRVLSEGMLSAGTHNVQFDARTLENGVYMYTLETLGGAVATKRLVVIH